MKQMTFLFLLLIPVWSMAQEFKESTEASQQQARLELVKAQQDSTAHNVIRPDFVVFKNKEMVISYAELILFDMYGKENIERQKPYTIDYVDNHWIVRGNLPISLKGGTFLIILEAHTGRILKISHGK
jgi:hypothetical protein